VQSAADPGEHHPLGIEVESAMLDRDTAIDRPPMNVVRLVVILQARTVNQGYADAQYIGNVIHEYPIAILNVWVLPKQSVTVQCLLCGGCPGRC
jgi:hypothetical protein